MVIRSTMTDPVLMLFQQMSHVFVTRIFAEAKCTHACTCSLDPASTVNHYYSIFFTITLLAAVWIAAGSCTSERARCFTVRGNMSRFLRWQKTRDHPRFCPQGP